MCRKYLLILHISRYNELKQKLMKAKKKSVKGYYSGNTLRNNEKGQV
ncbi:MAG: hypothetical protein FD170_1762 [Bacteroidetes bacterium]|nr:MAG: hypothetical protein FD170_1762 [Bacteroidota bacterium]